MGLAPLNNSANLDDFFELLNTSSPFNGDADAQVADFLNNLPLADLESQQEQDTSANPVSLKDVDDVLVSIGLLEPSVDDPSLTCQQFSPVRIDSDAEMVSSPDPYVSSSDEQPNDEQQFSPFSNLSDDMDFADLYAASTSLSPPSSPSHSGNRRGRWDAREDEALRRAVAQHKGNWKVIAQIVGTRTAQQCIHRWRKSVRPGILRTRWTTQEDDALKSAVAKLGTVWTKVAQMVPGRTDVQCRERWVNILNPDICHLPWTAKDDAELRAAVREYGVGKWSLIAAKLTRRRPDYGCRKRWEKISRQ